MYCTFVIHDVLQNQMLHRLNNLIGRELSMISRVIIKEIVKWCAKSYKRWCMKTLEMTTGFMFSAIHELPEQCARIYFPSCEQRSQCRFYEFRIVAANSFHHGD